MSSRTSPSTPESKILTRKPKKIASNIIKYRKAGGSFKNPEDLATIYGMTPEKVESLKPLLDFPKTNKSPQKRNFRSASPRKINPPFPFDPNTADSETLAKLGLSKKVISNINNYRNNKGTFRSPDNFSRIYGLSQEDFSRLKPFIAIKPDVAKKNARKNV